MEVIAQEIKNMAKELGGDLCGIASLERFSDAPEGFHPTDILKNCKSVIVVASGFPLSTLAAEQATYTFVRNKMVDKLDEITFKLSSQLEVLGVQAVPIPSSEPYEYWDAERSHGQGILSLKHAAVCAGLGKMGKNTLLINDFFGNMLWLGAILVDSELEADPIATYEACMPKCHICLDACPAQALDGKTIVQKKCRGNMSKCTDGGGWIIACNMCRKVCPNYKGLTK